MRKSITRGTTCFAQTARQSCRPRESALIYACRAKANHSCRPSRDSRLGRLLKMPVGNRHSRKRADLLGELLNLVHQASGFVRFDEFGDSRFLERSAQLFQMFRADQQREFIVFPSIDIAAGWPLEDINEDTAVRIERYAHQAFLAFAFRRFFALTSLTASSITL